ncbi:MAG: cytochrome c3 family protein [Aquificaceae bacterium]
MPAKCLSCHAPHQADPEVLSYQAKNALVYKEPTYIELL